MKLTNENLRNKIKETSKEKIRRIFRECQKIATYDPIEDEKLISEPFPVKFFTVPFVMEKQIMSSMIDKLDIFMEAMFKLEKFAFTESGSNVYDRLMNSLTDGGRHLVKQCSFESDYSLRKRHKRVDGYLNLSSQTYSIIEVNQAAPLATDFYDVSQRGATHLLNSLGFEYHPELLAHHILAWFIEEYTYRNPGKFPDTIALVIEHGYKPKFIDLPQMALICEELAYQKYGEKLSIKVCFPYEIKLSDEKIMLDDKEVKMIWRNSVYMTEYREKNYPLEDYEHICSNPDKYLLLNATRTWLTRTKEVFAILWDDKFCNNMGLSKEELKLVREIVPLSVNLKYNSSLAEKIYKEKDEWISKPSDAGFGKGVEFGLWHSNSEWKKIIGDRTKEEGFVFQKRVEYPTMDIMDINEQGEIAEFTVEFDMCPQQINGKFPGTALCRTNIVKENEQLSKMNLVGGGIILPVAAV